MLNLVFAVNGEPVDQDTDPEILDVVRQIRNQLARVSDPTGGERLIINLRFDESSGESVMQFVGPDILVDAVRRELGA